MNSAKLICLTPCKNENWVIDIHLSAASQWADQIVVGDQMSNDGTRETVSRHSKAMLVDNTGRDYDEGERHRVVFEAARRVYPEQKKILLAIDADELLSANWSRSPEWQRLQDLPTGTGIFASWANINPDFETWWPLGGPFVIGVVDNGQITHSPGKFHVPRLLVDPNLPPFVLKDIQLLHLQYTDPKRSQSKNRAYQVQEWLLKPERPVRLFRRFNSTLRIQQSNVKSLRPEWTADFAKQRVNWKAINSDGIYRWDKLVLESILAHGRSFFRKLDIWDQDWRKIAETHRVPVGSKDLSDPRSRFEKWVHSFLRRTQRCMGHPLVRTVQLALRFVGW